MLWYVLAFLSRPLKMMKNFVIECVSAFLYRPLKMIRNFVFGSVSAFLPRPLKMVRSLIFGSVLDVFQVMIIGMDRVIYHIEAF